MRKRLLGLGAAVVMIGGCLWLGDIQHGAVDGARGLDGARQLDGTGRRRPRRANRRSPSRLDSDLSGGLSNAADNVPTAEANLWLYDALYDYDAALNVFPQLAAEPADISRGRPGLDDEAQGRHQVH